MSCVIYCTKNFCLTTGRVCLWGISCHHIGSFQRTQKRATLIKAEESKPPVLLDDILHFQFYLKKMSAFETPLRPPKTPDYRPNLDEEMELTYTDPNLESDPEDSPPASQLEPRHKAALAKQRSNEGLRLQKESRQKENLPRNSRSTRQPRKRKHEDTISAIQFKKQKTETSILKLERHLQQKTCPKSLQYKAKANVTPDETFRQEISAIKSHAEEQYVSALVRFHQRRLVSHKNKLEKANIAKSRSQYNVNTRERSRSPLRNTVNTDADRIDKIENQLSELKDLICTRFQSDNKHVEKYNIVISEKSVQKIPKRSYPRRQNSLQTDRDLPIYTLFILPPARC